MTSQPGSLPTPLQEFIHKSRYARYLDDKQRRETWDETVDRYMGYAADHIGESYPQALEDWSAVASKIRTGILDLKIMPSMRLLMTAGEAVRRDGIAAYNCFYHAINQKRKFAETLHILLNGTGVGFSCERQEITKLPQVAEEFTQSDDVIVVQDSKKGWSRAYHKLINDLYAGEIPKVDYSKVRPAGARLKTFGGRSSGPEPLKSLFTFTINVFKGAAGRKLTSIEVHDLMCKIAEVVVVGGVRRSALISLSNLSDMRMRNAKSGNWWVDNAQRALSNNSAVYTEKPEMEMFMEEWLSLVKSKSGERGIFSRAAAQKQAARWGRRPADVDYGCNPCCVSGDTPILTDKGYVPIESVVGKKIKVWNGIEFSKVEPFSVGVHPTVIVELSDGTSLQCTKNHKWVIAVKGRTHQEVRVEAAKLEAGSKLAKYAMPVVEGGVKYSGDAYSQGFYSGDGTRDQVRSYLYEPKFVCMDRLQGEFGAIQDYDNSSPRRVWTHGPMRSKTFVPVRGTKAYCLNWLAGILDSDGCVTRDVNGNGFQISSVDKEFLLDIRLMLTRLGVRAKVVKMHAKSRKAKFANSDKLYNCKPVWRLLIGNYDVYHLGQLGLKTQRLEWHKNPPQRDARQFVTVVAVTPGPRVETFCFDEPKNHTGTFNGIVTGQSEIILQDGEFCNLTEVVVRAEDTLETLKEKVELCTILGTFQSTITNFDFINDKVKALCEKERLLGVSMTGVMDHPVLNNVSPRAVQWLQELRDHARLVNEKWAKTFKINVSVAITCNKPSGTVGQLVNSGTGGLHPRFAQYYIRTVRQDNKDPLTKFLVDAGVPNEPDAMKPDSTTVFSFPVKGPKDTVVREDRTAIEQLEHWLMFQRHWCEHKPSITVYVKDSEWMEVGAWVYKHFDEVSGVSFLPFSDHTYQQAPFQPIDEAAYLEMSEKMPHIDWQSFIETDDQTTSSQELACVAGACLI